MARGTSDRAEYAEALPAVRERHIRAALSQRLDMSLEALSGPMDWPDALVSALPFQETAARRLGRALQMASVIRGMIAGTRLVIANARDWGERELIEAIAEKGYGDARNVSRLDLRAFSGSEGLPLLLAPTEGGGEMGQAQSILGRALLARRSGLLVFENFDVAHRLVQQFLMDGMKRGRVTDYGGRDLHLRAFTGAFLLGSALQGRRLGFHVDTHASEDGQGFSGLEADEAVSLVEPSIIGTGDSILNQVIEQFREEGIGVELSAAATRFLETIPVKDGLSAYRGSVARLLSEALADVATGQVQRKRPYLIRMKGDRLKASTRRGTSGIQSGGG
jgi:hypothetical protein